MDLCFANKEMAHSSSIERLRWPEVVNNILVFSINQSSEQFQLGAGDLERGHEVDPFDHLITCRGSQAAIVCAVSGVSRIHHGVDEIIQLETCHVKHGPWGGDLFQGNGEGLQGCVVHSLKESSVLFYF